MLLSLSLGYELDFFDEILSLSLSLSVSLALALTLSLSFSSIRSFKVVLLLLSALAGFYST